jgi:hypothetical protein
MPEQPESTKNSKSYRNDRDTLLYGTFVRLRRLADEGFGSFFFSISLFCLGMILLRQYYIDQSVLDDVVRNELLVSVGSEQEPSDNSAQLGLIATALGKLNNDPDSAFQFVPTNRCTDSNDVCSAIAGIFKASSDIQMADKNPAAGAAKFADELFKDDRFTYSRLAFLQEGI